MFCRSEFLIYGRLEYYMSAKNILIIDDDPNIRKFVSAILASARAADGTILYSCAVAEDGEKGLESIEKDRPDCVILDIDMPGKTGIEVLERLRARKDKSIAGMPVLMLTTHSDAETVIKAIRRGAADYLVKPFRKGGLLTSIEKLLTRTGSGGKS